MECGSSQGIVGSYAFVPDIVFEVNEERKLLCTAEEDLCQ